MAQNNVVANMNTYMSSMSSIEDAIQYGTYKSIAVLFLAVTIYDYMNRRKELYICSCEVFDNSSCICKTLRLIGI